MEDKYDDIERFAKGEMNPNALEAFQKAMQADEKLAKEADFYKDVADFFDMKGVLEEVDADMEKEGLFKATTDQTETKDTAKVVSMKPEAKVRSLGLMRKLSFAASILLLVGAFSSLWFADSNYSNNELGQLGFNEMQLMDFDGTRSEDSASDIFGQGIEAMKAQDFAKAQSFFEQIQSDETNFQQVPIYIGYAALQQGDTKTAMTKARSTIQSTTSDALKDRAEWLLVKSLLAESSENTELQQLLTTISNNPEHSFQKQAKALSEKLNSVWRKLVF